LLSKNCHHQLSDIIDEIAIRRGQVIDGRDQHILDAETRIFEIRRVRLIIRVILTLTAVLLSITLVTAQDSANSPSALRVIGKNLVDSRSAPVRLRGVNTASLEWTSDGEGHILETVRVALEDWKVNHVRLPLSQDRWFGKAPEQSDGGRSYRALVRQIIDNCSSQGVYVMPELHWSNGGQWGQTIGQHAMPDLHSVTFWKDFATKYKNHPAVIFDLYNEPHGVSWDIWRDGGEVTERLPRGGGEHTYQAVGMQTLLDAVRSTGARNVTVIAGLDWSYDLSGILEHGPLHDPLGNGLLYANHAYPFKGDTVDAWIEKMVRASRHLPLIISEFGSETHPQDRVGPQMDAPDQAGMILNQAGMTDLDWVEAVLDAIEKNGWHWTAWNLHPAAGPRLISDWGYTPTPHFGVPVKRLLLSNESPLGSGNLTRPDR